LKSKYLYKLRGYLNHYQKGEKQMKKVFALFVLVLFSLSIVGSATAGSECPQPRKTASAPGGDAGKDMTGKANKANGEKLFQKTTKPMACAMCHGANGDGNGKLGAALKPKPRNFTCAETMKDISAGQMFWIIKNGSKGTPMTKQQLKDGEIWDVVKYIREDLMK
jgi:mono/diheme cytochrome c family protein